MGEMIQIPEAGQILAPEQMAKQLQQVNEAMQLMAGMLRATTEAMEGLRRQVRMLEKVTPAQASSINARIRGRAAELCDAYRLAGQERAVSAMIRKDFRLKFGAASVRDLPRCDYETVLQQLTLWDDYKAMKKLREKVRACPKECC